MSLDPKLEEKLKAEFGNVTVLSAAGVSVAVKNPSRAQFRKFQAEMDDARKRLDAPEQLLRACVVYPDAPGFDKILEDKPGLVLTFGGQLMELAGVDRDVEKKAL